MRDMSEQQVANAWPEYVWCLIGYAWISMQYFFFSFPLFFPLVLSFRSPFLLISRIANIHCINQNSSLDQIETHDAPHIVWYRRDHTLLHSTLVRKAYCSFRGNGVYQTKQWNKTEKSNELITIKMQSECVSIRIYLITPNGCYDSVDCRVPVLRPIEYAHTMKLMIKWLIRRECSRIYVCLFHISIV